MTQPNQMTHPDVIELWVCFCSWCLRVSLLITWYLCSCVFCCKGESVMCLYVLFDLSSVSLFSSVWACRHQSSLSSDHISVKWLVIIMCIAGIASNRRLVWTGRGTGPSGWFTNIISLLQSRQEKTKVLYSIWSMIYHEYVYLIDHIYKKSTIFLSPCMGCKC